MQSNTNIMIQTVFVLNKLLVFQSVSNVIMKHAVFAFETAATYFLCNVLHKFRFALTLNVKQILLPLSVIKSKALQNNDMCVLSQRSNQLCDCKIPEIL